VELNRCLQQRLTETTAASYKGSALAASKAREPPSSIHDALDEPVLR